MFENTPDAYCPACGRRVPARCMDYSETSGIAVAEVYECCFCGARFYVETGLLSEVN